MCGGPLCLCLSLSLHFTPLLRVITACERAGNGEERVAAGCCPLLQFATQLFTADLCITGSPLSLAYQSDICCLLVAAAPVLFPVLPRSPFPIFTGLALTNTNIQNHSCPFPQAFQLANCTALKFNSPCASVAHLYK